MTLIAASPRRAFRAPGRRPRDDAGVSDDDHRAAMFGGQPRSAVRTAAGWPNRARPWAHRRGSAGPAGRPPPRSPPVAARHRRGRRRDAAAVAEPEAPRAPSRALIGALDPAEALSVGTTFSSRSGRPEVAALEDDADPPCPVGGELASLWVTERCAEAAHVARPRPDRARRPRPAGCSCHSRRDRGSRPAVPRRPRGRRRAGRPSPPASER